MIVRQSPGIKNFNFTQFTSTMAAKFCKICDFYFTSTTMVYIFFTTHAIKINHSQNRYRFIFFHAYSDKTIIDAGNISEYEYPCLFNTVTTIFFIALELPVTILTGGTCPNTKSSTLTCTSACLIPCKSSSGVALFFLLAIL